MSFRLLLLSHRHLSPSLRTSRRRKREEQRIQCSRASYDCYLAWKSISNDFNEDDDDNDIRLLVDVDAYTFGRRCAPFRTALNSRLCISTYHRFRRFLSLSLSVSARFSMPGLRHTHAHRSTIPNIFLLDDVAETCAPGRLCRTNTSHKIIYINFE